MRIYNEVLNQYIEIPDNPRIISLSPSITEILFLLGYKPIGVSYFCSIPSEAKKLPKVGGYLNIDYKVINSLNPDLIFTTTGIQRKLVLELLKKGYNVYPIVMPQSPYGILENIVILAEILSLTDKALSLINKLTTSLERLYKALNNYNAYFEVDLGEPVTIGRFSYINISLLHIGLNNIFKNYAKSYFNPLLENINFDKYEPDIIIYECRQKKPISVDIVKKIFLNRGWKWKAIKNERIIVLTYNSLTHHGPSHIDTLSKIVYEASELL